MRPSSGVSAQQPCGALVVVLLHAIRLKVKKQALLSQRFNRVVLLLMAQSGKSEKTNVRFTENGIAFDRSPVKRLRSPVVLVRAESVTWKMGVRSSTAGIRSLRIHQSPM